MEPSVPGPLRMELVSDQWSPADGVAEQAFDQLVFAKSTCVSISCWDDLLENQLSYWNFWGSINCCEHNEFHWLQPADKSTFECIIAQEMDSKEIISVKFCGLENWQKNSESHKI